MQAGKRGAGKGVARSAAAVAGGRSDPRYSHNSKSHGAEQTGIGHRLVDLAATGLSLGFGLGLVGGSGGQGLGHGKAAGKAGERKKKGGRKVGAGHGGSPDRGPIGGLQGVANAGGQVMRLNGEIPSDTDGEGDEGAVNGRASGASGGEEEAKIKGEVGGGGVARSKDGYHTVAQGRTPMGKSTSNTRSSIGGGSSAITTAKRRSLVGMSPGREGDGQGGGKWVGRLLVKPAVIGHGSPGPVVLAGPLEGRPGAVKRLLGVFHERAAAEVAALVTTDAHPNVVRCLGAEEDEAFVYVALERCAFNLADLVIAAREWS